MTEADRKRPIYTKRTVVTKKADEATNPLDELVALNESLQGIPFSHNEARRLTQRMLGVVTKLLANQNAKSE